MAQDPFAALDEAIGQAEATGLGVLQGSMSDLDDAIQALETEGYQAKDPHQVGFGGRMAAHLDYAGEAIQGGLLDALTAPVAGFEALVAPALGGAVKPTSDIVAAERARMVQVEPETREAGVKPGFLNTILPAGATSMATMLVPGAGARVLGAAPRVARGISLSSGALQQGQGMYMHARSEGASDSDQRKAYLFGLGIGATEMLPVERVLSVASRLGPRGALNKTLALAITGASAEAVQEGLIQTPLEIAVSQHILEYADKETAGEIAQQIIESAGAGAILGGSAATIFAQVEGMSDRGPRKLSPEKQAKADGKVAARVLKGVEGEFDTEAQALWSVADQIASSTSAAFHQGDPTQANLKLWPSIVRAAARRATPEEKAARYEGWGELLEGTREMGDDPARFFVEQEMRETGIASELAAEFEAELEPKAAWTPEDVAKRLGQVNDRATVTIVEPAEGDAELLSVQELAAHLGVENLVFVGGIEGGKSPAMFLGGQVAIDAAQPVAAKRALLVHEAVHNAAPAGTTEGRALLEAIQKGAPELLAAARLIYNSDFARSRAADGELGPQPFVEIADPQERAALQDEEAIAKLGELMPRLVQAMVAGEVDISTDALLADRSVVQTILDWIIDRLNQALGTDLQTTERKGLEETLRKLTAPEGGGVDILSLGSPEEVRSVAQALVQAFQNPVARTWLEQEVSEPADGGTRPADGRQTVADGEPVAEAPTVEPEAIAREGPKEKPLTPRQTKRARQKSNREKKKAEQEAADRAEREAAAAVSVEPEGAVQGVAVKVSPAERRAKQRRRGKDALERKVADVRRSDDSTFVHWLRAVGGVDSAGGDLAQFRRKENREMRKGLPPGFVEAVRPEGKGASPDVMLRMMIEDGWFPEFGGDVREAEARLYEDNPNPVDTIRDFLERNPTRSELQGEQDPQDERMAIHRDDAVAELVDIGFSEEDARREIEERFAVAPPTDTPEFKRWFKDSAVVDASGEPLVVYHGTTGVFSAFDQALFGLTTGAKSARRGFFFIDRADVAGEYAEVFGERGEKALQMRVEGLEARAQASGMRDDWDAHQSALEEYERLALGADRKVTLGANVIPAYLALENPRVYDFKGKAWEEGRMDMELRVAHEDGNDGMIFRNVQDDPGPVGDRIGSIYIAFRPEQIKSATGNVGTFSAEDPDIRFAVADDQSPDARDAIQYDGLTKFENARRYWQDYFLPVRRAQAAVGEVPEAQDVSLAETLYPGATQDRIEKIREWSRTELSRVLGDDIDWNDAHRFLWALHADERNKYIQARDVRENEGEGKWGLEVKPGSGMKSSEAATIVKGALDGPDSAAYGKLRRFNRTLQRKRLATLKEAGLLSEEFLAAIKEQGYEDYVPLIHTMAGRPTVKQGKGFQTRGSGIHKAGGRTSEADNTLVMSLAKAEEAVVRAEKAKVDRALYNLVKANPDPSMWSIHDVPTSIQSDDSGVLKQLWDMREDWRDYSVPVMVDGKQKLVVFNKRGEDLARALKQTGIDGAGPVLKKFRAVTRYLSAINTSWNPEFILSNFARDLQTAGIVLSESDKGKVALQVMRRAPSAVLGIHAAEAGKEGEWKPYWDRLKAAGGKTGFYHAKSLEEIQGDLTRELETLTPATNAFESAKRYGHAVVDFVEGWNSAVENGVRLSAFRYAVDVKGLSDAQAAEMAKNLTVNFNRKGEANWFSSLYMFANASIQGSVRVGATIAKSKRGRKIAAALVLGGALLDALNYMLSPDDEDGVNSWDAIPEWKKDRYLMFPDMHGGFISVPMGYGFNVFPSIGRNLSSMARYVAGEGGTKPLESTGNIASSVVGAFSPVGDFHNMTMPSLLRFVAPTVADPLVEIATNEDYRGMSISPTPSPFSRVQAPSSQTAWDSTPEGYRDAAAMLNTLTGGNEFESGALDISPDALQHLMGTAGGGLLRFGDRSLNTARRAQEEGISALAHAPFIRQLYQTEGERQGFRAYRENATEIELISRMVRGYFDMGEPEKAAEIRSENRALLRLEGRLKALDKYKRRQQEKIEATKDEVKQKALANELYERVRAFNRTVSEARERP